MCHFVVIQSHGEHVYTNEDHDYHIKLLAGYNLEHHGLWFKLGMTRQGEGEGRQSKSR